MNISITSYFLNTDSMINLGIQFYHNSTITFENENGDLVEQNTNEIIIGLLLFNINLTINNK